MSSPQLLRDHQAGAGAVIDLAGIVALGSVGIHAPAIIARRAVAPDDASGLLDPAVRIDELGPDRADIPEGLKGLDHPVEPPLGHRGVVVQEQEIAATRRRGTLVARMDKPQVFVVPHESQSAYAAAQLNRRIGRAVVDQDDLERRLAPDFRDRLEAPHGVIHLVVDRDDDGDERGIFTGQPNALDAFLVKGLQLDHAAP